MKIPVQQKTNKSIVASLFTIQTKNTHIYSENVVPVVPVVPTLAIY
jgi:hypothetical protein